MGRLLVKWNNYLLSSGSSESDQWGIVRQENKQDYGFQVGQEK